MALARAIALRPDDDAALDSRGVALQGLDRPAEALTCHDRALAIKPANPAALNNRGHALLALERYAEALESYDRALAFAPPARACCSIAASRSARSGSTRRPSTASTRRSCWRRTTPRRIAGAATR